MFIKWKLTKMSIDRQNSKNEKAKNTTWNDIIYL